MKPKIKSKRLSDFRQQTDNLNKHTQRGMGMLESSMQEVGYAGPMVAAADGEIIDGSARNETAENVFGPESQPIIVESDGKPAERPKNLTGKTIVTPEGRIRPGNNRPYSKATLQEQEERIDFCLKMLIRGCTKAEIHRQMSERYNLDWRTIDDIYIVRATKLRVERAAISNGDMRDTVITRLLEVLKTGKDSQVISACAALADIFGLNAPRKQEISGPEGEPIRTQTDVRRTMVLPAKDVEALRSRETAPEGLESN